MAFRVESRNGSGDEEMVLWVDSEKWAPAPFLRKTYELVDDPRSDLIVSWGEDDSTFVVWRPPEFARDLLPNYFKHNNFSSFVRQLNTYGFKKVVADRWEFANDYFRKGEKHLLCEIQRRRSSQSHHHHHPPFPCHDTNDILAALSDDSQRLRKRNFMLASELSHMKGLYNDIIYFIQNHVNAAAPTLLEIRDSSTHVDPPPPVKLFGVPLQSKKRFCI